LPSTVPAGITQAVLSGIRVLDFSWVLAGPYTTRMLADFGAEVIKVQPLSPSAGDRFSRGYFNTWNRNKLAITLDPGKPEGLKTAMDLVKICDVVVENFSPRVMSNWGMDYSELKKIQPDIIFLSLSMMGHSGPWLHYSGFGPAVQAFSGITSLTSYADRPPIGMGFSYADHVAGLYGALAVLAALEYRRKTGEGQYIDLSETEAMASLLFEPIIDYTLTGHEAGPRDHVYGRSAPEGIYACSGIDKWCAISVTDDKQWQGLKRALGNPPWAEDRRFETLEGRNKNSTILNDLINGWTSRHSSDEVMAVLQKEGVPAGVVQSARDLWADPQLRARGFFQTLVHPVMGETMADASPIHLSENPPSYRHSASEGGQDNDYVFQQLLGLNEEDYLRYQREKVI
jgi:benzylsuccinate CoA-transferase BbsF subunit